MGPHTLISKLREAARPLGDSGVYNTFYLNFSARPPHTLISKLREAVLKFWKGIVTMQAHCVGLANPNGDIERTWSQFRLKILEYCYHTWGLL